MLLVRSKVWLFVLHVSLCIRLISNRLDWERVLSMESTWHFPFLGILGACIINFALHRPSVLTHITLTSFLWDKGKQNSPRCDAAKRGVPSWAILFACKRDFHRKMK